MLKCSSVVALSSETIDKIKSLSISSVLDKENVYLKKVGREFVTNCIWHKDKNPSLTVSDEKGFVFCHACREGGDIIHFIQKKFGLTFREACERIASSNNIQVIYEDEDPAEISRKREEIQRAAAFVAEKQSTYRANLKKSEKCIEFLKTRRILPETSRHFQLGYNCHEDRLMIPIKDYKGIIVGFTGRALGDEKPKYKNTENNIIFNKSDIVFNEFDAIEAIREANECIFVEGHIDVISMWQAGIKNVVAIQGTGSPSINIINRILRRTSRFILCLDSDDAGEKAIGTFLNSTKDLALQGKIDIRIANITNAKDPDEAICKGIDMHSVISDAMPWMDWILDQWLDRLDFSNSAQVQEAEKRIKEMISGFSSAALRAHYYDKAAIRLAQNKQHIAAQILKNFQSDTLPHPSQCRSWKRPDQGWTRSIVEKRLLRLYIHSPQMRDFLRPLTEMLIVPDMIWLWNRIKELEENSSFDCTPASVMALLAVSEPRYMQKLRPIAKPTIEVDESPMVLAHIEDIMMLNYGKTDEGTLF